MARGGGGDMWSCALVIVMPFIVHNTIALCSCALCSSGLPRVSLDEEGDNDTGWRAAVVLCDMLWCFWHHSSFVFVPRYFRVAHWTPRGVD